MAEVLHENNINQETVIHTLRFGNIGKVVRLTQQQLDRIPYLSTLASCKDDFSSIQNENGEYVLSSSISYRWFKVILNATITEKPSTLFTELPEKSDVLGLLQLYDYLCIDPIPIPVLKDEYLTRSITTDTNNGNKRINYRRATVLETRDTAAQFIIALSKNEYNVDDVNTLDRIFYLIAVIMSNPNIFNTRFCHHTMEIAKEYCFPLLCTDRRRYLLETLQFIQSLMNKSLRSLYNDDQSLPKEFQNAFAWKVTDVSKNENYDNDFTFSGITVFGTAKTGKSDLLKALTEETITTDPSDNFCPTLIRVHPWSFSDSYTWELFDHTEFAIETMLYLNHDDKGLYIRNRNDKDLYIRNRNDKDSYITEAKSARSRRFNTLLERPKVDKFKHRCGPKAQKYR